MIAGIEFHDARVASFRLGMDGQAEIDFTHLVVFQQVGQEEYDVWSYRARLALHGVSSFELAGELVENDYVIDDELAGADGTDLACEHLIGGATISRFSLTFFDSGATVTITCRKAKMSLGAPVKFLEKWHGPLTGQDS